MDLTLSSPAWPAVQSILWPLLKLLGGVSLGLFIATLIESLNWTRAMARIASPLVSLGRLSDTAGASFSAAFFSGEAANTLLAEHYEQGRLSFRELVLANLFNSLPTYFLRLPSMVFLTLPILGFPGAVYIGLTLSAAFLRTLGVLALGRLLLPVPAERCIVCLLEETPAKGFRALFVKTMARFKRRLKRIVLFTLPIYALMLLAGKYGGFVWLSHALGGSGLQNVLPPQAVGIVLFQMTSEFSAGLAAAGALLDAGGLTPREVVLALLVGAILASPMQALRRQFPYYAGIFKPAPALRMVVCNQCFRVASLVVVGALFYALPTGLIPGF